MVVALHADEANAVHEAELRVQTSISVREQYKTKLRTLVDSLLPPPQCDSPSKSSPVKAATTQASKKKQLRDVIADRQRVRATMPAGKELQVVGDWLLLLRAASVNVVESISHWRDVVHQGRGLPYEVDHANYLLCMAHDTDFLDTCEDLVTWLGFRLVRNPFITCEGLGNSAHAGSSVINKRGSSKKIAGSPPALLVMPLVSILPEDDVVDGSRIASAQSKLIEEEALYGRSSSLAFVEKYFARAFNLDEIPSDDASQVDKPTNGQNVFEAIVASTKSLRMREHHLMVVQRDRTRVADLTNQLEHQIRLTKHHSEHDLVSDHRVWQYREQCRQHTLHTANSWLRQLHSRLEVLDAAVVKAQHAVEKGRNELDALVRQREQARQLKRQEAEEQERRQSTIRQKTLERNRDFKVKRTKKTPKPAAPHAEPHPPVETEEMAVEDLMADLARELGAPPSPVDKRVELDQKRQENLDRRKQLRQEHDRIVFEETKEMDRRRNENALMFLEDRQSMLVEIRRRHAIHKRIQRERVRKLTAMPIFSTVQHLGGIGGGGSDKKFRVAVYDHRAKGYALDGLRLVAYDPSTSTSLSLLLSTREYSSLGYGRTQDGLNAFCQWLCVIYDRRKRQRNLVWSGAPCPPPLRIREYDHALLCVHKEGLRLPRHASSSSHHFVAAYIRTSDTSKLHFVISSVLGVDSVNEIAVPAAQLLPTHSMVVRADYEGGHSYPSWLHDMEDDHASSEPYDHSTQASGNTRVFSGDLKGLLGKRDNQSTRVHVFDVSSTEYELRFAKPIVHDDRVGVTDVGRDMSVVLLKHDVNPYAIRLPHSAFGDLLTNLRLEEDAAGESIRAVVMPTWRACLARYVRAIRMAKFGCKIDGIFHLVVVTLVQQKTEFRAHLLFELAAIGVGIGTRQSLRIGLSQLLRCPDSIWRPLRRRGCSEEEELVCEKCLSKKHGLDVSTVGQYPVEGYEDLPEASGWREGSCEACGVAQQTRLEILQTLLESRAEVSSSSLEYLYYGACEACGTLPPPIVVAMPRALSNSTTTTMRDDDLDNCVSQYFAVFREDVDLSHADGIAFIRESLEHNRICVVRVTLPTIPTQSIARDLVDRIRTSLLTEHRDEQPVTVALVVEKLDIFKLPGHAKDQYDTENEHSLEQALYNLAATVAHIGQLEPIAIDSEGNEAQDGVFNFETYLVSEALLVEAIRVVLHPEIDWRLPGETVGASSWSTACELLQHPSQLSTNLQHRQHDLVTMSRQTRTVLDAYTTHPKWPPTMDSVREPFQPLLATILHVVYVQHLLEHGGGLLSSYCEISRVGHFTNAIYELEHNVSIITISGQKGSSDDFGQLSGVY